MINFFVIFFLLSLLIYLILHKNKNVEPFSDDPEFVIYVISLGHADRIKNVEEQKLKIDKTVNIEIFNAVKGDHLNIDELIEKKILKKEHYFNANDKIKKRELGCYFSHCQIYDKIKTDGKTGYTIIFEDDFLVKEDRLMDKIKNAILKLDDLDKDFDIIYLGNTHNNHGEKIIDNLYYVDNNIDLYGMHAYIVNNSKIDKLINNTKPIYEPIDCQLFDLWRSKIINIVVLFPTLVVQGGVKNSTINDLSIENFSNNFSTFY